MVSLHAATSQPLTKLMILQHAVNVITSLEGQVRGRYNIAVRDRSIFIGGLREVHFKFSV